MYDEIMNDLDTILAEHDARRVQRTYDIYAWLFLNLNLDEMTRLNRQASEGGYLVTPYAAYQDVLDSHVPAPLLQVEDLTPEMYPNLSQAEYESMLVVQAFVAKTSRLGIDASSNEKDASATLDYLMQVADGRPADGFPEFPLQRIAA